PLGRFGSASYENENEYPSYILPQIRREIIRKRPDTARLAYFSEKKALHDASCIHANAARKDKDVSNTTHSGFNKRFHGDRG
ncbi:MAG: hypothetical protein Q9181_006320, partial [Wetmoreana brouardii]